MGMRSSTRRCPCPVRGISDLIEERFGGRIIKGYLTTLYIAHRW